jgi:hydrogenase maturation protease
VVVHRVAHLSGDAPPAAAAAAQPGAAPAAPSFVVIGCGNLNRSDDAVGVRVIRQLRLEFGAQLPAGVNLFDAGTGGLEVMFQARGATALVIVDACRSGSEAGAIFRLPGSEIDTVHQPAYSLHDFRWDHAVHAGRMIFGTAFPTDVCVYLIEAASLELGTELTATASRAVDKVCAFIAQDIRKWSAAHEP